MPPSLQAPQLGKSGNAVQHGLSATDHIFISRLHPEDRAILEQLRTQLFTEYDPQTTVEELLVDKIAIHLYRQYRFYRFEYQAVNAGMNHDPTGLTTLHHLDRLSRYDARLSTHLNTLQFALRAAQRARGMSHHLSQAKNSSF